MMNQKDRLKHTRKAPEIQNESENVKETKDQDSGDDGPMPLPMPVVKKRKKTSHFSKDLEQMYLSNLPNSTMYEISYMHRDQVTHVLVSPETQFIITASIDGHVKFWKKMQKGIEFVKHYKAHNGEIMDLRVSLDGLRLVSTGEDCAIKFYDVIGFDMVNILNVDYIPCFCCWTSTKIEGSMNAQVAITDMESPKLRIYQADQVNAIPIYTLDTLHQSPITLLAMHPIHHILVTGDSRGHLEYLSTKEFKFPSSLVKFQFKLDTDLYALAKAKTFPTSIAFTPRGDVFAVTSSDSQIRLFSFQTGKLKRTYDESIQVFEDAHADGALQIDTMEFGRRIAIEKEYLAHSKLLEKQMFRKYISNVCFDAAGNFIIYSTLVGIKIVNWVTNELIRIVGKGETGNRFIAIALFQEKLKINSQYEKAARGGSNRPAHAHLKDTPKVMSTTEQEKGSVAIDPTIIATSFKKSRFYLFTTREPIDDDDDDGMENSSRDILNEKPSLAESEIAAEPTRTSTIGDIAILHTTMGDITIRLFGKECPRTVENFCTHATSGYYDNVIFHRVIPNFMIQTGDPLGDGTGGESIWGGEFEDELNRNLRHDRPFTVSMANSGPNTNGSQFFITTVPTPWLDMKHTVFGRVENGKDTVSTIEKVRTSKMDKPLNDISIINIDIK